ncbi:hypothetical protein AADEFJLK_04429 [Methylovulum psychrotolerans]|uniref:Uncharacterized protein n=1 Tax=Methylovulum psychrotolerans TaxID=1704499 RepID=A0A2S5CG87_9GAMM|nr:hypothetical protein AADEFJLK_04429 [Methylovulum psychrotolerans]
MVSPGSLSQNGRNASLFGSHSRKTLDNPLLKKIRSPHRTRGLWIFWKLFMFLHKQFHTLRVTKK